MAELKTVVTTVIGCARCGNDHEAIEFKRFEIPIKDDDGLWEYWALCPVSGDPILLKKTVDNAADFENISP